MRRRLESKKQYLVISNADRTVSAVSGPFCAAIQFGAELHRLRTDAKLSQIQAAKRAGLARGYYSQLENSKRLPPPVATLKKISNALNLSSECEEGLARLAAIERCSMLGIPDELPMEMASLVKKLAANAYRISPLQLRQISAVLGEVAAM